MALARLDGLAEILPNVDLFIARHRRLLWEKKISSPIAVGNLEQLFYTPVVSIGQTAAQFGISYQAASTIVAQLEKAGILRETTGKKRDKRFVYNDYLNILTEGTKI
jgi:predicted transcriptional regulator